jgi:glycosyltransferase involved in cell wall biosynthesis
MRVAHLLRKYNPAEWGGTESAILQLATDLEKRGVESVIYAPKLTPENRSAESFEVADRAVRRFRARVSVWGISPARKAQLVSVGGNLISFDLAASLWREVGLDVVHSHAQGRLGAIARVVARARRLPFVVSIHGGLYDMPGEVTEELRRPAAGGWDWGKPLGLVLRARQLMDHADAIITLNPREAALIKARHPGRRVLTLPHGVPTAMFARESRLAALEAYPGLRGRSVLLVLGRIDPVKNQDWLIAHSAEISRRHPEAMLVFVGASTNREYGDAMKARIAREGLQDSVLMAGCLPFGDPRLIGLLQLARAVVLPSRSETFGIVIVEAWAAGTPVISSRTSGAMALVTDGVDGLLFDLDRPATFHSAVDRVLAQRELAIQWGSAGRAKAVAEFDTSIHADRMKRLYEELIGEKNALRHSSGR